MRNWEPPVSGDEIKAQLGLDEGVAVGMLKEWVREAVLDGTVPNEHDAAWAYVLARQDEAVRRGALFQSAIRMLKGPQRGAIGAVKEALFWGDVPEDAEAAQAFVEAAVAEALGDDA